MNKKIHRKIKNDKAIVLVLITIFISSCSNSPGKLEENSISNLSYEQKTKRVEKLKSKAQNIGKASIKHAIAKSGVLTLDQVIQCINQYNPRLKAAKAGILETQGKSQQQMLYPNPTFEFESENMPLNNFGDFGRSENSFTLKQRFIMPWKRSAKQATLDKQVDIVKQDYVILEYKTLTKGKIIFFELLAIQEKLDVVRRLLEVAKTSLIVSEKRVKTGEARNVESIRAQVEYSQTTLEIQELESEMDSTSQKLLLLMGTPDLKIKKLQGMSFTKVPEFDPKKYNLKNLKNHPEVQKGGLSYNLSELKLQQAEKERWPDIEVGIGIENDNNEDEEFFRLSFEIPLPIFNRNQGKISEANGSKLRTASELQAIHNELKTSIDQYLLLYLAAKKKVDSYKKDIIPKANQTFELTKKLYQSSEVGQIELLSAQQTLVKAELGYTDALANLWRSIIHLEYFTGLELLPD